MVSLSMHFSSKRPDLDRDQDPTVQVILDTDPNRQNLSDPGGSGSATMIRRYINY